MLYRELAQTLKFWTNADRIGPDMPITQVPLLIPSTMRKFCSKKLKNFGAGSEIRVGAYLEACSKISIGDNVVIRPGTFLFADPRVGGAGIEIENDVLIGSGVHFYTNNHKFSDPGIPILNQGFPNPRNDDQIVVKRGAWIGAMCIILPGVVVGENSVVGAGSVVTKSVPPRHIVAGNPAKVIREIF